MSTAANPYVSEQGDILANIHTLPWLEVGGGTRFKVLRACRITGDWALFVNMEPGASFQPHRHQGPGARGDRFFNGCRIDVHVGQADIGKHGGRAGVDDGIGGGGKIRWCRCEAGTLVD